MPKIPFTALATPGKIGKYSVQSLATDFSKASHYAFSSERTLVFYSVGSRLYAYDYNPGHERVQDLGDWDVMKSLLGRGQPIKKQSMTCISRLIIPLMAVGYVS